MNNNLAPSVHDEVNSSAHQAMDPAVYMLYSQSTPDVTRDNRQE